MMIRFFLKIYLQYNDSLFFQIDLQYNDSVFLTVSKWQTVIDLSDLKGALINV